MAWADESRVHLGGCSRRRQAELGREATLKTCMGEREGSWERVERRRGAGQYPGPVAGPEDWGPWCRAVREGPEGGLKAAVPEGKGVMWTGQVGAGGRV